MKYQAPKALELGHVENLTFGPRRFGKSDDFGGYFPYPAPEVRIESTDLDETC